MNSLIFPFVYTPKIVMTQTAKYVLNTLVFGKGFSVCLRLDTNARKKNASFLHDFNVGFRYEFDQTLIHNDKYKLFSIRQRNGE